MATAEHRRGRLVVFLGVGKTTAMLAEGARLAGGGTDVVVALIETHGRTSTEARLQRFDRMSLRRIRYRDAWSEELDVDAILRRHPGVVLLDAFDGQLLGRLVDGRRAEAATYRSRVTPWELDR